MLPELKYFPVNWVDGMKVTKSHFVSNEAWLQDGFRDTACLALTDHNYGLLPSISSKESSLDLAIREDRQSQQLYVQLHRCRAVTRGGCRIEITPASIQSLDLTTSHLQIQYDFKEAGNMQYNIILMVHPHKRVPAGTPDPEEHPMRYPYTLPEYRLDIVPSQQTNNFDPQTYHLTLGKFRVVAGEVQLDPYIPPCMSVSSHPDLYQYYRDMEGILMDMSNKLTELVRRLRLLGQHDMLENNLRTLAEQTSSFIFQHLDDYKWLYTEQPPIHMILLCVKLARVIQSVSMFIPEDQRTAVYQYVNQGFTPQTFEESLNILLNVQYDHQQIRSILDQCRKAMENLRTVFTKLPQMNYTRKEPENYVWKEQEPILSPQRPPDTGGYVRDL